MTDFLHGVETIKKLIGTVQIDEVKTAVVLLVGTAPIHQVAAGSRPPVNSLVLVTKSDDYAQFGPDLPGYSIPASLAIHAQMQAGLVLVVNVFDPAVHKTDVTSASLNVVSGVVTLAHADITALTVSHAGSPDVLAVEGTDYTVDRVLGIITIISTGILHSDATVKVAYSYANPSVVAGSDIVGAVSGSGVRSGLQCGKDAQANFGFSPKIILAPGFSATKTTADAMAVIAASLRAVTYTDYTVATSVNTAITGRTPGNSPDLSSVDPRSRICGPHIYRSDGRLVPISAFLGFLRAKVDRDYGYWYSASNKPIPGVTKPEIALTCSLTDETCDANRLNAAGITTVFVGNGGDGIKSFGNRTNAFPGSNTIDTFEAVLRTRDVLEESIEYYAGRKLDLPINQAFIDGVLADVNEFINTLISRGALAPGSKCYFDPAQNPSQQLANGNVAWSYQFCPPPPCERMTFNSTLNTNLLQLGAQS